MAEGKHDTPRTLGMLPKGLPSRYHAAAAGQGSNGKGFRIGLGVLATVLLAGAGTAGGYALYKYIQSKKGKTKDPKKDPPKSDRGATPMNGMTYRIVQGDKCWEFGGTVPGQDYILLKPVEAANKNQLWTYVELDPVTDAFALKYGGSTNPPTNPPKGEEWTASMGSSINKDIGCAGIDYSRPNSDGSTSYGTVWLKSVADEKLNSYFLTSGVAFAGIPGREYATPGSRCGTAPNAIGPQALNSANLAGQSWKFISAS